MVLRRQFNKLEIVIGRSYVCERIKRFDSYAYYLPGLLGLGNSILIQYFDEVKRVLRNYGHLIRHLRIGSFKSSHGYNEKELEETLDLVNLHCTQKLETIFLHDLNKNDVILKKLTVPFEAVETVWLISDDTANYYYRDEFKLSSEFGFNRIFPSIRYLHIESNNFLDSSYKNATDYVMPHLEYVERREIEATSKKYLNETHLGNLIKYNPQIKSILLADCNPNSLEFLSTHAPNLENLTCYHYNHKDSDDYSKIRLSNLKILAIGGENDKVAGTMPRPFECEKLEEISVKSSKSVQFADILAFIENCSNLGKIDLISDLDDEELLTLARIKLKISEFKLQFRENIKLENVVQFMKISSYLAKFQISIHEYKSEQKLTIINDISAMLSDLDNEWTIEVTDDIILLKRKY